LDFSRKKISFENKKKNFMEKLLLLTITLFLLLACQEDRKEATKEKQTPKDTLTNRTKRKKITFEDIKGRFLHKNSKMVSFDIEDAKLGKMLFTLSDTNKHTLTRQDLIDIGLDTTQYKNQYNFYLAYALHQFELGYLLCYAYKTEVLTKIDVVFVSQNSKKVRYCFSINSGGDAGFRAKDFMFLQNNKIEVHTLEKLIDKTTYKKYQLTFLPNFELKADTLDRQFRQSYENDLFQEILTKHGLRAF
jgi:hypothetical protein